MLSKLGEIFLTFLKLGLTSFGGPVAHLGYFYDEFVRRRQWIEASAYAELVALCQILPGPASSQVGMALGLRRAGPWGALAAWAGFTMPSAVLLVLFAKGLTSFQTPWSLGVLHGLKIAAIAVVAQALMVMSPKLCPDKFTKLIALLATFSIFLFAMASAQIIVIALSAFAGFFFLKKTGPAYALQPNESLPPRKAAIYLVLFAILILLLPTLAALYHGHLLELFDSFFRVGSLVFGGGHVVLPLLQAEVVPRQWVTEEIFMAGYGAAQAVPGPLFAFSAYLGAASKVEPAGWTGAWTALVAIFTPAYLLVVGIIPFWERFKHQPGLQNSLRGINAGVLGLLLAAFFHLMGANNFSSLFDLSLALVGFLLLAFAQWPSWRVVSLCALAGALSV